MFFIYINIILNYFKLQASEKGSAVGLKELFDRTHAKETEAGKVYVNTKAERATVIEFSLFLINID